MVFESIIEWYNNRPDDYKIIYSFINYLNINKKANICFIPNSFNIYTTEKDYTKFINKDKDKLSYKIENKYNEIQSKIGNIKYPILDKISISNTNISYLTNNSSEKKKETNNKINRYIADKNIIYDIDIPKIINGCKDIAFLITVIEFDDIENPFIDKGHAILAYYNFECKTILLINNYFVEIKEDIEKFLNKILKLEKEIEIYCPRFLDKDFPTFQTLEQLFPLHNTNETGLCVIWQFFILQNWIFRENPKCNDSFEEFQNKILIPNKNILQKMEEVAKKKLNDFEIKIIYSKILINNFIKGILNYRNELKKKLEKDYNRFKELENKERNINEENEYEKLFEKLYIENRLF